MLYFSYNDFIDCTENGEINTITNLEENGEIYELIDSKKEVQHESSKIIKILNDEIQMTKFLNEFLNLKNIEDLDNLLYYNNIKKIRNKNKTVICKIKNKEIFIFVRVIDQLDYNISYKMFDDSLNIFKEWKIYEKRINKRKPIVIPVVIYIGEEIWENKFINNTLNYITIENNRVNFSYNILNIHNLDNSKLKKIKCEVAQELTKIKNKYLQTN